MTNHKIKPTHPRLQQYSISLRVKSGKYELHVPELCLFASHQDIGMALKTLNEKATDIFAEYEARGIIDELPKPATKRTVGGKSTTVSFAIKCLIFATVISCAAYLGSTLITHKINQMSIATVIKKQIKGASMILDSWSELDPQRKDVLLDSFEKQLQSIKPVVDRANKVFYPKIKSETLK
jgi:hypothetical protein